MTGLEGGGIAAQHAVSAGIESRADWKRERDPARKLHETQVEHHVSGVLQFDEFEIVAGNRASSLRMIVDFGDDEPALVLVREKTSPPPARSSCVRPRARPDARRPRQRRCCRRR